MKNILFLLLIGIQPVFSQNSNLLIKGNDYFNKLGYAAAIPFFEKVQGTENESTASNEKLAYCYLFTNAFVNAESLYKRLINENKKADNYYFLGYTQLRQGKSLDAMENFKIFAALNPTDSRSILFQSNPRYIEELVLEQPHFSIQETNINSKYDDFGIYPYPIGNGAVMVSGRNKSGLGTKVWAGDDQNFLELYYTKTDQKNLLSEPIQLAHPINSSVHDGPLCFNSDGTKVYFTSNTREKNKNGENGIQQLKIYIADIRQSEWVNIREFKHNSTNYACGHPSLSRDGKTFYFVSDMPGGFGGADIYKCTIDANDQFGKPENLGVGINTSGQELFPWIGNEGNLYFSSNGRPGFGGLDVFVATTSSSNQAKNVGQPINSMADDFALTFLPDGKFGYVSSDRNGSDDIFAIELIKPFTFMIQMKGKAVDSRSNQILANTKIELKDASGKVISTLISDENGLYNFDVEPGSTYSINASQNDYQQNSLSFVIPENTSEFTKDIAIIKKTSLGLGVLISDNYSKKPISGVQVKVTDVSKKTILMNGQTAQDGRLEAGVTTYKIGEAFTISIEINAPGYLAKKANYLAKFDSEGLIQLHEKIDLNLQAVNLGGDLAKMLNIKPIYFDLNKFNIRKDAAVELDKIVKVLNENPTMVIELGSHTDCRGTQIANETLSQNRASSSANYIKTRITNPERISGKGYGETKLLNDCGCEGTVKSTCSDQQHQLNRRTEFIIVKM
jgi:outer membrane protein OmpA-like peptidoglycan-associated protein/Tol biopolymer transport system component